MSDLPALEVDENGAMTPESAERLVRAAYPDANARRTMCGGCGRWSELYPLGDLGDAPPGWERPSGEYGWAAAPKCPDCQVGKRPEPLREEG
jgi:hypothetical protein